MNINLSRNDIIESICRAGVIGGGGAGFPTHVKYNARADTVIVNGAECEPLLRVDQQLVVHKSRRGYKGA